MMTIVRAVLVSIGLAIAALIFGVWHGAFVDVVEFETAADAQIDAPWWTEVEGSGFRGRTFDPIEYNEYIGYVEPEPLHSASAPLTARNAQRKLPWRVHVVEPPPAEEEPNQESSTGTATAPSRDSAEDTSNDEQPVTITLTVWAWWRLLTWGVVFFGAFFAVSRFGWGRTASGLRARPKLATGLAIYAVGAYLCFHAEQIATASVETIVGGANLTSVRSSESSIGSAARTPAQRLEEEEARQRRSEERFRRQ